MSTDVSLGDPRRLIEPLTEAECAAIDREVSSCWEVSHHTWVRCWTKALAMAFPTDARWVGAWTDLHAEGLRGSLAYFREEFDLLKEFTEIVAMIREATETPEGPHSWIDEHRDPILLAGAEKILARLR